MASITIDNLKKTYNNSTSVTYTDLHLDVIGYPVNTPRDILVDNDIDAIKNSISNLFNTIPGQKLLSPNYGLSLMQYLFEPVTTNTANIIGETILNGITRFEPRVVVDKIKVSGNSDDKQYTITLIIRVPLLSSRDSLTLNAVLSENTNFTFI
jgi:uncharacterized protein